jgi:hypothetical protein
MGDEESRALRGAIDQDGNDDGTLGDDTGNATNLLFGNATDVLRRIDPHVLENGGWSFSFFLLCIVACCFCMYCCNRRQGRIQSALARGACLPIKADPLGPIFSNSPLNKAY